MKCPKCNKKAKASATKFIEYSHAQRRIRTCECGFKFTTYERIEADKQDLGKHSKEKKKDFYRKVLKEGFVSIIRIILHHRTLNLLQIYQSIHQKQMMSVVFYSIREHLILMLLFSALQKQLREVIPLILITILRKIKVQV